jgi:hypothetical protein
MDICQFSYNHNIEKKTLLNKNVAEKNLHFRKKPENLKIIFI